MKFNIGDIIKRPTGKELYLITKRGHFRRGSSMIRGIMTMNIRTRKMYFVSYSEILKVGWMKKDYVSPIKQLKKHKMV